MITRVVVTKINRAFFGKKEPVEIMITFFDDKGRPVGSQLLSAALFDDEVQEGQAVNFKTKVYPMLMIDEPTRQD